MPETADSVIYMNIRRKVRDAASRGNKFREAFIIRYDVVGNIVASVRENLFGGIFLQGMQLLPYGPRKG